MQILDNRNEIIRILRENKRNMQINLEELKDIVAELTALSDGCTQLGVDLEEKNEIVLDFIVEKFKIEGIDRMGFVMSMPTARSIDKKNDWWYNTTLNKTI